MDAAQQTPARTTTNGLAVASLVLGILWLTGLGSLLALILGLVARKQVRNSSGAQTGAAMATAGTVLGAVGLAITALMDTLVLAGAEGRFSFGPFFSERRRSTPGVSVGAPPRPLVGRFPKCAAGFPMPHGARPETSLEHSGDRPCVWTFSVERSPADAVAFYKSALEGAGLKYSVAGSSSQFTGLTFSGANCGSVSIQPSSTGKTQMRIAVAMLPCPKG